MRTATVRDLRNRYTQLLAYLEAGEEIIITRRGKSIARLVPELSDPNESVDWSESPAVARKREPKPKLSAIKSASILREAGSQW